MKHLFLAAFILCSVSAHAQDTPRSRGALTSGNYFLRECESETSAQYAYCLAYSTGVWDIVSSMSTFGICSPSRVEMGQVFNVGIAYMRNNPAKTHEPPAILLIESWRAAFPCPKPTK